MRLKRQKPIAIRTPGDPTALARVARETGVATQLGNQRHAKSGMRRIVEAVRSAIDPCKSPTKKQMPAAPAVIDSEQSWQAIGSRLLELTLADA